MEMTNEAAVNTLLLFNLDTTFFCSLVLYHQLTSYHYTTADYAAGRVVEPHYPSCWFIGSGFEYNGDSGPSSFRTIVLMTEEGVDQGVYDGIQEHTINFTG